MSIRINRRETPRGVIVELHGRLSQEVLGEFEGACDTGDTAFSLDLSGLAGVDEAGLQALRARIDAGVRTVGVSPYVLLLLQSGSAASGDQGSPRRG
jgi:anti-anti-sigma regulatory factor